MNYPKWKYRIDPVDGAFQSTLVATAEAEASLDADGVKQGAPWTDDPHAHGVEVVPYPAELTPAGTLMHHPTQADANGNHPHGPAPTTVGIGGVVVGQRGRS